MIGVKLWSRVKADGLDLYFSWQVTSMSGQALLMMLITTPATSLLKVASL